MTSRAGLRFFTTTSRQFQTSQSTMRQPFRHIFRRYQTTAANPPAAEPQSLFQRLLTSEVGIKTVHFWAPIMKWGVVIAGASDFFRPPEKLSATQNLALMATGSIWTRWCFVIRPQNMLLAAVNFCLFCVGATQCSRIIAYNKEQTGSTSGAFRAIWGDISGQAKSVEKEAEKNVKEMAA